MGCADDIPPTMNAEPLRAPAPWPALPIDAVLPALLAALDRDGRAVLVAPPGAGKTTRVPLALLDAPWAAGRKIVMLEPRRIAARAAAAQMARLLGEAPGGTVGYRIRMDRSIGPRTRIEVVTEGILTRMLQDDPALEGVAALIFDEFHERSLNADLGLALALDAAPALRPDLRLVVMSATIAARPVADLLGGAPIVESEGRLHPVETRWRAAPAGRPIEDAVAAAIRDAVATEPGSVLAFLPGGAEIRRTEARLAGLAPDIDVLPLYGDLPAGAQDAAVRPPPPGRRKIVLATNIAETSLTIEGVRIVVDGGLARTPVFDPRTGMTRLETIRISRAEADQRRGRAGRTAPGLCWRLWARDAEGAMAAFATPEIRAADLAPLALELAVWGTEAASLAWLDPPAAAPLAQARVLLGSLGALDAAGRVTAHGRAVARLAAHPRLAHMMLVARDRGLGALAAGVAALLEGRRPATGLDLRSAVEAVARGRDDPGMGRTIEAARQFRRRLGIADEAVSAERTGEVLALAFPDRVGLARPGTAGAYRLSNGRGAALPPGDALAREPLLAIAEIDDAGRDGRILAAAPLDRATLEDLFADAIATVDEIGWDETEGGVTAWRQRRLGALVLDEAPLANPDPARVRAALLERLRARLDILTWSDGAAALRRRVAFARRLDGAAWPDWSDAALEASVEDWLGPWLDGVRRRGELARLDLLAALRGVLGRVALNALDTLAPASVTVPTGRAVTIDYADPAAPAIEVKLQEMFGARDTPRIGGGRVPLTLRLLSPAGRPLQVTRELGAFWAGSYAEVRREMRGRYPRHPWPDDPLAALPTARAKPRGS